MNIRRVSKRMIPKILLNYYFLYCIPERLNCQHFFSVFGKKTSLAMKSAYEKGTDPIWRERTSDRDVFTGLMPIRSVNIEEEE